MYTWEGVTILRPKKKNVFLFARRIIVAPVLIQYLYCRYPNHLTNKTNNKALNLPHPNVFYIHLWSTRKFHSVTIGTLTIRRPIYWFDLRGWEMWRFRNDRLISSLGTERLLKKKKKIVLFYSQSLRNALGNPSLHTVRPRIATNRRRSHNRTDARQCHRNNT